MPTWYEHLEAALSSNCHRIADLCELREQTAAKFDRWFARCDSIEKLLHLETNRSRELSVIDAEIALLSVGSRKLMDQMAVA